MEMTVTKATFPKYPTYKDSGVEWLGEIPVEWDIHPGLRFISENKSKNSGMVRNTVLSLSYGKIRVKHNDELTGLVPESFETYQLVNKGDLIFRPTDLQNDKVSLRSAISEYDGIITNAYINLKFKEIADSKFFHYFFRAVDNNKIIYGLGSGLRQNISYLDFRRFKFPFPPLEEQTAIAKFLDDKTAKIDRAIAQKEQLIALLKERKQIIIQNAVTKGLDPNAKMKHSGVEWIGEIPEGWEVIPIRRLVDVRDGTHDTPMYIEESVNSHFLITSKDFKNDEIDFSNAKSISKKDFYEISKRSGVDSGDVIMSMIGGNIGKSVIAGSKTDYAIKNVGLFKTHGNLSLSKFIKFYLQSGLLDIQVEINSRGGAQGFLSLGDLRNLKFFKIPTQEQAAIVAYIEVQSAKIDKAIGLQERQIEKLKELKATLIDGAVTGKLRVPSVQEIKVS